METIEVKEEFQIPGTDVVVEAGDKLQVLKEAVASEAIKQLAKKNVKDIWFDADTSEIEKARSWLDVVNGISRALDATNDGAKNWLLMWIWEQGL